MTPDDIVAAVGRWLREHWHAEHATLTLRLGGGRVQIVHTDEIERVLDAEAPAPDLGPLRSVP